MLKKEAGIGIIWPTRNASGHGATKRERAICMSNKEEEEAVI